MKQIFLSFVVGIAIGAGIIYFYMNRKLEKYNSLRQMTFVKKSVQKNSTTPGRFVPDENIGRTLADQYVANYQAVSGLPIKGLIFPASEIINLLKHPDPSVDPDKLMVYFGKKSADANTKNDYTVIITTIKSGSHQEAYYADEATPCPDDCPQNAIGN